MRSIHRVVALLLVPLFLVSSPALAQQARIVDASAMHDALAARAATEREQRETVLRALDREDVREMAARFGLDVADARSAVAALDGADLSALAQHAGALEASDLAGGANTIVISTTTLLLLIIIIILLAK
jgi:hypothetical protein